MKYKLIWQDLFEVDGKPNEAYWVMETGGHGFGNNEQQYYTDELKNVYVKDGILNIVGHKENYQNQSYTSAKITTENKKLIMHGKIEVVAKIPPGNGTWPAIWLLGNQFRTKGWPLCGEIDLMEHVGHHQNIVHFSLHSKTNHFQIKNQFTKVIKQEDLVSQFHAYSMTWSKDEISFFLDDKIQQTFKKTKNSEEDKWPFNQPFYLIINLALGGTWGGKIDDSIFPVTFQIKSVKIYERSEKNDKKNYHL